MLCSGIHLYTKTSRKPYFKRFLGMKKAHDNSIKITVDICLRTEWLIHLYERCFNAQPATFCGRLLHLHFEKCAIAQFSMTAVQVIYYLHH